MKIFIIRDSQLTGARAEASIKAFAEVTCIDPRNLGLMMGKLGGMPYEYYASLSSPIKVEEAERGAIWEYKTGRLSEQDFYVRMKKAMSAPDLTQEQFTKCWNKMCECSKETIAMLQRLMSLQEKHAFGIHIIASSNQSHQKYIAEQLAANRVGLQRTYTRSYEMGTLDPVKLLEAARKTFAADDEIFDLRAEKGFLLEMIEKRLQKQQEIATMLFSQIPQNAQSAPVFKVVANYGTSQEAAVEQNNGAKDSTPKAVVTM